MSEANRRCREASFRSYSLPRGALRYHRKAGRELFEHCLVECLGVLKASVAVMPRPISPALPSVSHVRPVNPFLRPMLRSGHGRKGVNHGTGDTGPGARAVLATGPGAVAAAR